MYTHFPYYYSFKNAIYSWKTSGATQILFSNVEKGKKPSNFEMKSFLHKKIGFAYLKK